jgi:low affinity Fe/Cu permease
MLRLFGWTLTQIGVFAGHPAAFVVTAAFVAAWLVLDFKSFGWHATATVVTWFMTLFIQRADNRDGQALHAKLDELIRVHKNARQDITDMDKREPEAIEEHRAKARE